MSAIPSEDNALARQVQNGVLCVGCVAEQFHPPLGHPAACPFCWARLSPAERVGVRKAPREAQESVIRAKAHAQRKRR